MEALAKLGIDTKLLIAQVVNFVLLLLILKRYAYKPVLRMLDERSKKIEKGLADAEAAEKKLALSLEEEKKILVSARDEARGIVAASQIAGKKRDADMLEATKQKIDKMIAEADNHLAEEQKKLLREAKAELASVVISATERVLLEKMNPKLDQAIIEKALQETKH